MKDRSPTTVEISTVLILLKQMEQNFYKATEEKKKSLLRKKRYPTGPILYFVKIVHGGSTLSLIPYLQQT